MPSPQKVKLIRHNMYQQKLQSRYQLIAEHSQYNLLPSVSFTSDLGTNKYTKQSVLNISAQMIDESVVGWTKFNFSLLMHAFRSRTRAEHAAAIATKLKNHPRQVSLLNRLLSASSSNIVSAAALKEQLQKLSLDVDIKIPDITRDNVELSVTGIYIKPLIFIFIFIFD